MNELIDHVPPVIALRVFLLVAFGLIGVFALRQAAHENGWGLPMLLFGCYLCLLWIALRPDK